MYVYKHAKFVSLLTGTLVNGIHFISRNLTAKPIAFRVRTNIFNNQSNKFYAKYKQRSNYKRFSFSFLFCVLCVCVSLLFFLIYLFNWKWISRWAALQVYLAADPLPPTKLSPETSNKAPSASSCNKISLFFNFCIFCSEKCECA